MQKKHIETVLHQGHKSECLDLCYKMTKDGELQVYEDNDETALISYPVKKFKKVIYTLKYFIHL